VQHREFLNIPGEPASQGKSNYAFYQEGYCEQMSKGKVGNFFPWLESIYILGETNELSFWHWSYEGFVTRITESFTTLHTGSCKKTSCELSFDEYCDRINLTLQQRHWIKLLQQSVWQASCEILPPAWHIPNGSPLDCNTQLFIILKYWQEISKQESWLWLIPQKSGCSTGTWHPLQLLLIYRVVGSCTWSVGFGARLPEYWTLRG
jgi:hypothetical protein